MERMKKFLYEREKAGTLRQLSPLIRLGQGWVRLLDVEGELLDFSSNDYLALSEHPEVISASRKYLEMFGAGAGAARLMSGDMEINHLLEQEIARWAVPLTMGHQSLRWSPDGRAIAYVDSNYAKAADVSLVWVMPVHMSAW